MNMALPDINPLMVETAVKAALLEDLGRAGDITTQAIVPAGLGATAILSCRKPGTIAGLSLAVAAFQITNRSVEVQTHVHDGERVSPGTVLATIKGEARSILSAERVALNFLSHLSGIATLTSRYTDLVAHTHAKICCTRKTTPGLRTFEKYAVRCGGGMNHRFGLDDAILIKDNHIAVAGGIVPALRAARAATGHLVKIEIEVDTLEQLGEVLDQGPSGGADVVMLDNMTPDMLQKAVTMIAGRVRTEASGGVNLETVRQIAEAGVDLISVGALTHSAPVLDIGLDIVMG